MSHPATPKIVLNCACGNVRTIYFDHAAQTIAATCPRCTGTTTG